MKSFLLFRMEGKETIVSHFLMRIAVKSMRTGSAAIGVGSMSISWSYAWSSGMGWRLDISVCTKVFTDDRLGSTNCGS